MATGLNIVKGFAGQVTVGHVALAAVGAFTSAVLSTKFGMPFWICMPVAVVVTVLTGALVAIPSFRLEGAYLALATLAFAQAVEIFIRVTNYLGSASGIGGIKPPVFFGIVLRDYQSYYYLAMPMTVLAVYASFRDPQVRDGPRLHGNPRGSAYGGCIRRPREALQADRLHAERGPMPGSPGR